MSSSSRPFYTSRTDESESEIENLAFLDNAKCLQKPHSVPGWPPEPPYSGKTPSLTLPRPARDVQPSVLRTIARFHGTYHGITLDACSITIIMPPDRGRASKACTSCRKIKTRCYESDIVGKPCLRCDRLQQPCSLDVRPVGSSEHRHSGSYRDENRSFSDDRYAHINHKRICADPVKVESP